MVPAIEALGFIYSKPKMKQEYLEEEIEYFVLQNIFVSFLVLNK